MFKVDLSDPDIRFDGAVCTIGVFDGLHSGHEHIISMSIEDARSRGVLCIAITFDVDPDELFGGTAFKKIMSNPQRIEALVGSGVDAVAILSFDEVSSREPDRFLDALFLNGAPAAIRVGSNFRYGAKAAGNVSDLEEWGRDHGVEVHAHDLLKVDGDRVSSTRVRSLLEEGDVAEAAKLLGHEYAFTGKVEHGREAGRDMGIRTANLFVPDDMRVLADGVYAAYALVDGKRYKAAVSVGVSPTFSDSAKSNMEAHILGFEGDLYGKAITVEFVEYLRPMQRFDDTKDLVAAIQGDITWVQENL